MSERFQVYKCDSCGNIVEILYGSNQQVNCCGKPMRRLLENVVDASVEKHVPVVKESDNEIEVKAPEAKFRTNAKGVVVRELCNLHGLWKA